MNYKNEIKKMSKHREKYFPVMNRLLKIHKNFADNSPPVHITNGDEMRIILELIDIGYINIDAFIIKREFEDITDLIYNGERPLTDEGYAVLRQSQLIIRKKFLIVFIIIILSAILLLIII